MVKRKPTRVLLYVLIAFGYLILVLIFPALDPTRYLPAATACMRKSESELLTVAREGLEREVEFLVRNFGESAEDIKAAEIVQFVEWTPRVAFAYSVTYRTARGLLYEVNISPGCGIELSFPSRLGNPEARVIYRKQ